MAIFVAWNGLRRGATTATASDLVRALRSTAEAYGRVATVRAYADWAAEPARGDAADVYRAGGVPVYVPMSPAQDGGPCSGETEVQATVDALDLATHSPELDTFVLVAFNDTLAPLLLHLRARGRRAIVVDAPDAVLAAIADANATSGEGCLPGAAPQGDHTVAPFALATPGAMQNGAAPAAETHIPNRQVSAAPVTAAVAAVGGSVEAPAAPPPDAIVWSSDGRTGARTIADRAALRELVQEMVLPSSRDMSWADCAGEVQSLIEATRDLDERWGYFSDRRLKRLLTTFYVARARHVQQQEILGSDRTIAERLVRVFHILTLFSKTHQPGIVRGLQIRDEPQTGSWLEDAIFWYDELRQEAGMTEDVGAERQRLVTEVGASVSLWQDAPESDRERCLADVEAAIRRCFHWEVDSGDRQLARQILPIEQALRGFKTLRQTAKDLKSATETASPPVPAGAVGVCDNEECGRLALFLLGAERETVAVSREQCEICFGSNDRRAAMALVQAMRMKGLDHLLVVGGTNIKHVELDQLLTPHGIELRCVDGVEGSFGRRDAQPDLQWAQVMVIWQNTPLPHKVSKLYTDATPKHVRRVFVEKTGIEALCRKVISNL